jgi:hypothetical protein
MPRWRRRGFLFGATGFPSYDRVDPAVRCGHPLRTRPPAASRGMGPQGATGAGRAMLGNRDRGGRRRRDGAGHVSTTPPDTMGQVVGRLSAIAGPDLRAAGCYAVARDRIDLDRYLITD